MIRPHPSADAHPLAPGVLALPDGFALLERSRVLVCADAHLAYEDAMAGGGALPLWSTTAICASVARAARAHRVSEIVFLGDAIHAPTMSEGAARAVRHALSALRAHAHVIVVAGNHEGRSRGVAVLGDTVESCERDGWLLVHGDRAASFARPTMIGHFHPSLRLARGETVPVFLAAPRLVVLPALTPYSSGLDVRGDTMLAALARWNVRREDAQVVAAGDERVYPFGSLAALAALDAGR